MIEIDGSYGEGGGQILRTSTALAALLGQPIKITRIRARRRNPGLAQQHLTGIKALQRICNAKLSGAKLGSTEIEFAPGEIKGGKYEIDIGTAGSVTLVLQSLMLPLAFADSETELQIKGGTDVRWSPPSDYLANVFIPTLRKLGYHAEFEILARGYYPKGSGKIRLKAAPSKNFKPLVLEERGKLIEIKGAAHSLNLPCHIVERAAIAAKKVLAGQECGIRLECGKNFSTGCGIALWANYENTALGASALGEIGKPAEKVGEEAALELASEMRSRATLDVHAGDQIVPYLALASGESRFTVRELSGHLKTNIFVVEKILGTKFETVGMKFETEQERESCTVKVSGAGISR